MPFSPELGVMPEIASKFFRSGVAQEILLSLYKGDENRNLVEDGRRVVAEFKKVETICIHGLENIKSGALVTFNHPNNDFMFPGFLDLVVNIHDRLKRDVKLVMASEIMLFANLNDKKEFPGSIKFMERFHRMYGGSIISTPTVESRKDFVTGRAVAVRKILRELTAGNIIAISPEGHIENDGVISPPETFHPGSGAIARLATRSGIPTVPVGVWGWHDPKKIFVRVGPAYFPKGENDKEAVNDIMAHIASLMPFNLRGPFSQP